MASLASGILVIAQEAPTVEDVAGSLSLDSFILAEQFYFFTVVIMWLIHVGFMAYEAGAARRKNIMSTAMKNILTIAVVTPSFYYFGWYIYGCFEHGGPLGEGHAGPVRVPGLLRRHSSLGRCDGPEPPGSHQPGVLPGLPPLLLDDGLDHVRGAHRARPALGLPDPRGPPRIGRVDHGRRLGLERRRLAVRTASGSTTRSPRGVVHGVAGAFALGVLLNLGPRIGKYDLAGRARTFRAHNTHLTLMGLMLIFTGFYGFYAACLVIQSTVFPGWVDIYLDPTTLGSIAMVITFGFAGGFTGGWFASKGDPFWTLSGGLAGVISVSAGADIYHPSLAYLLSISGGMVAVYVGTWIERKLRIDDAVGAVAVHGFAGSTASSWSGSSRAVTRPARSTSNRRSAVSSSGSWPSCRSGSCPAPRGRWVLKKLNLLRVPPEVELEGLDMAEFQQDFFPEFERVPETVVLPDGEEVESAPILLEGYSQVTNGRLAPRPRTEGRPR